MYHTWIDAFPFNLTLSCYSASDFFSFLWTLQCTMALDWYLFTTCCYLSLVSLDVSSPLAIGAFLYGLVCCSVFFQRHLWAWNMRVPVMISIMGIVWKSQSLCFLGHCFHEMHQQCVKVACVAPNFFKWRLVTLTRFQGHHSIKKVSLNWKVCVFSDTQGECRLRTQRKNISYLLYICC